MWRILTFLAMLAWFGTAMGGEIHEAAKRGDVKVVRALLGATPYLLNERDNFGKTSLYWATINNQTETVAVLLGIGANANIKDNVGRRPLEIATNREIALLLKKRTTPPYLEKGDDVHIAAATGSTMALKLLLDRNPGLVHSTTTSLASTPLHWAASKGHKEAVALLLDRDAPVNAQDLDGNTPLHKVAAGGFKQIAEILLKRGADVNLRDELGRAPLHLAVSAKPDMVELLLNRGADPNVKDARGFTPLHAAALQSREKRNTELLLLKGAKIEAVDSDGWTPLHAAVYYGCVDVVELLLASHASVNARTKKGETALQVLQKGFAEDQTKTQITEMLTRQAQPQN